MGVLAQFGPRVQALHPLFKFPLYNTGQSLISADPERQELCTYTQFPPLNLYNGDEARQLYAHLPRKKTRLVKLPKTPGPVASQESHQGRMASEFTCFCALLCHGGYIWLLPPFGSLSG